MVTRSFIAGIFGFTFLVGIQSSATAASLTGTVKGGFDFFLPGPSPMIEGSATYSFDKQTGKGKITFKFDAGAMPMYQIEEGRKFPEPDYLVTFKIVQTDPMSMGFLQASFSTGLGDITNIPGFGGAFVEKFTAAHVPEPSSILSLLALGTLGAGSAFLRKKQSKSEEN